MFNCWNCDSPLDEDTALYYCPECGTVINDEKSSEYISWLNHRLGHPFEGYDELNDKI